MSWKDRLRKATFRDVPFHVEQDEATTGRRNVTHEYPQRDKPYVEDLGRATREFTVTGFVIGADYDTARDRLLGALEVAGPGTLVHPWFGSLKVSVREVRVTQSNRDGGMARFSIGFVEAGELEFPKAADSTAAQVRIGTEAARAAAITDFDGKFSVKGVQDAVLKQTQARLSAALGSFAGGLQTINGGVAAGLTAMRSVSTLSSLMNNPSLLASRLFSQFAPFSNAGSLGLSVPAGVTGGSSFAGSLIATARGLIGLVSRLFDPAPLPSGVYVSSGRRSEYDNALAINSLMRRATLLSAADVTALADLPVYDDAVDVRQELTAALDAEMAVSDDTLFLALSDTRVAVYKDLTARTRDSARLRTVTPAEILPAVAIAYDLYEDAARENEIVARNGIVHPGFVRAEPIRVLSR